MSSLLEWRSLGLGWRTGRRGGRGWGASLLRRVLRCGCRFEECNGRCVERRIMEGSEAFYTRPSKFARHLGSKSASRHDLRASAAVGLKATCQL
jgi:hypothetical protein